VMIHGIHGVDRKIHTKALTIMQFSNLYKCETEMLSIFKLLMSKRYLNCHNSEVLCCMEKNKTAIFIPGSEG
jgi:hypothetical protein